MRIGNKKKSNFAMEENEKELKRGRIDLKMLMKMKSHKKRVTGKNKYYIRYKFAGIKQ